VVFGGGKLGGLSLGNRPVGLNLEALRDNVDQPLSELQVRREKFAFFEKHCTRIVEGVYVGGDGAARNRATLDAHGITHVINCNAFIIPNYFEVDLEYKTLWLTDTPNEDITCVLYDCFDFIRTALAGGGRVLVHCSQVGPPRVCIAPGYMVKRRGAPLFVCEFVHPQYVLCSRRAPHTSQPFGAHRLEHHGHAVSCDTPAI